MQIFTPLVYLAVRMSALPDIPEVDHGVLKKNLMHLCNGLSSNYPDAETYKKLGTRAKDSKGQDVAYYKVATKADELKKYLYSD